MLSWCIEQFIEKKIFPYSCNVQGFFFTDIHKTLSVLDYMVKSYEIYTFFSTKRNVK